MARTQAADYRERRESIVEKAAELYAARGFLGASLSDLARVCGVSKSLIYHYYPSKEDILFDVMHSHVRSLLNAAEDVLKGPGSAADKLRAITVQFMKLYAGAASRQRVLLNDLNHLPSARRAIIVDIQRRLVGIVEGLLTEIRDDLTAPGALQWPTAMLYFGMINWTHTWMDPDGPVKAEKIANLASGIFLDGLAAADIPK